ncbi:MAG: hypothetical protein ACOX2L_02450 [Anaerolineae bacterium]|jgi:transaldolase/glucose-6-phosphate isomerase|nr:hypothetical protein [Chloroflexota bacterium]
MCPFPWMDALKGDYLEILHDYSSTVQQTLDQLTAQSAGRRIWARDGGFWSDDPGEVRGIEERLGWLDLPEAMRVDVPRLEALRVELRARKIERAVLLGMGGSSLAPEVLSEVFGVAPDGIALVVLDATDPAQIRRVQAEGPLERAVFIAASKSGTTAETRTLLEYFGQELSAIVGDRWVDHVIVITDPGTPLVTEAREKGFLATYLATPEVGGRYSALSLFGLVPGALLGIDCDRLLKGAKEMAERCRATVAVSDNPGIRLGAALGALAQSGRDKLTYITSPSLASFGWWGEQLIAESTGKLGTGILPIESEPERPVAAYGQDRVFAYLRLADDANEATDALVQELVDAGQPVLVMQMDNRYALGAEFFRWEMATAVAGQILGINPFDQPNVEQAKDGARLALQTFEQTGALARVDPVVQEGPLALYGAAPSGMDMVSCLSSFLEQVRPCDYVAIMAYVDRNPAYAAQLQEIRALLGARLGSATTVGFGPRFLHSTGQLHKGGSNSGFFLQLTQTESDDLAIPGHAYSFGVLKSAQAAGDMVALVENGRRVLRIDLGTDVKEGLGQLLALLKQAL